MIKNVNDRFCPQVEMTGLTGIIKFDHQGFRSDFILDIIELNNKDGLKKIGTWNSTKGINFTRSYGDVYTQIVENLQNKTFIVTTILVRVAFILFQLFALIFIFVPLVFLFYFFF